MSSPAGKDLSHSGFWYFDLFGAKKFSKKCFTIHLGLLETELISNLQRRGILAFDFWYFPAKQICWQILPSQHFLLLLEAWWHRFSLNCSTIYQSLCIDDPMWMHFKCEEEETITTAYIYHAYMQICKYIYIYICNVHFCQNLSSGLCCNLYFQVFVSRHFIIYSFELYLS